MNKNRWIKWGLVSLVVVLLAAGVFRALAARSSQQTALAEQIAHSAQTVVELSANDVIALRTQDMLRGLPVSGTLRAANSALIKARVQGELQGLLVREGDAVRAGQVLARIEAAEYEARLRQAQQQADAARAQIDITQRQHDDNQALVEQGFISKTALNNSRASLNAARASYEAAVASADVARKSLNDAELRSPMNGFVSQRLAQPGERVAVDTKILEIVDLSRLEIEAALSAADSVTVRVGQKAQLQVEGYATPIPATVARINPSTQAGSRSVLIYLQLQPTPGLRQGLFVQGTVGTEKLKAMALPVTAVRTDKPEPYVQIVENEQVRHLGVKMGVRGQSAGQEVVAVSGLPEGSQVLAGSVGPLREGTLVKSTPAR